MTCDVDLIYGDFGIFEDLELVIGVMVFWCWEEFGEFHVGEVWKRLR